MFPENPETLGMEKPGNETTVNFAIAFAFQHHQPNNQAAGFQRSSQLQK